MIGWKVGRGSCDVITDELPRIQKVNWRLVVAGHFLDPREHFCRRNFYTVIWSVLDALEIVLLRAVTPAMLSFYVILEVVHRNEN